jgi:hypothetical protein
MPGSLPTYFQLLVLIMIGLVSNGPIAGAVQAVAALRIPTVYALTSRCVRVAFLRGPPVLTLVTVRVIREKLLVIVVR